MSLIQLEKIADMQCQIALGHLKSLNVQMQNIDAELVKLRTVNEKFSQSLPLLEEQARDRWLVWRNRKVSELSGEKTALDKKIERAKSDARIPIGRRDILQKLNLRQKRAKQQKTENQHSF